MKKQEIRFMRVLFMMLSIVQILSGLSNIDNLKAHSFSAIFLIGVLLFFEIFIFDKKKS